MLRNLTAIAAVLALAACAAEEAPPPAAAPAPAPAPKAAAAPAAPQPSKCETELKRVDGAILGVYTKLRAIQFDAAQGARDKLAEGCAAKVDDAKAVALAAEVDKAIAPGAGCAMELRVLDGKILGAYTKLSAAQFDKVGAIRERLADACEIKAANAKIDSLLAEADKTMAPKKAPAKKAAAKKAPAKK
ncbi:MAG: hypothetical protein HZC25_16395 [Rhodospirillales bacterium]|nr:hypothetical protein [Rhodospirillales bacterium]